MHLLQLTNRKSSGGAKGDQVMNALSVASCHVSVAALLGLFIFIFLLNLLLLSKKPPYNLGGLIKAGN